MMPTMTQSGSCIDPCKEIYLPGSRCRLKVFEILLRLLFFPSFLYPIALRKNTNSLVPYYYSDFYIRNEWILEELLIPVLLE